ncbi:expressed unknown protein [Seminavis robusta]|uniref:YHYH domain-containing protein n=1 Tax=Seminavis robusta TaxID=568900 RepID=A0A9N8HNH4_9STRA|nr:expressed unknown protein [Seminavis robusta]|eukprot:Sro995_g229150.1 n/a (511) ;mRNA; r:12428-13960
MKLLTALAVLATGVSAQGQPEEGGNNNDFDEMGGMPSNTVSAEPYTITGTPCSESSIATDPKCTIWMINTDAATSVNIENDGAQVVTNVEAVTVPEGDNPTYFTVYTSGIPDYSVLATQALVDTLNARPMAATDFASGATSVMPDEQPISFGQDIGYVSQGCDLGYWPPGPVCPNDVYKAVPFPLTPTPEATTEEEQCDFGLGIIGLFVNGVSMFDWRDGFSYNGERVWSNIANQFEPLDLDVCGGHAAGEEYHHHGYSTCLQDELQDDGTNGHSPIIGMMPDGNLNYGLYQDTGVKAQSCWKTRDYSNPDDPLGCGGTGSRTCVMVDNTDPTQGTMDASSPGPSVTDEVASLSSNVFVVTSGFYYEDYYFDPDCYAQGGEYLDEHNGHSHGDYGYHYHATEAFPYLAGPDSYYGQVLLDEWTCGDIRPEGGPPGGSDGGPPNGGPPDGGPPDGGPPEGGDGPPPDGTPAPAPAEEGSAAATEAPASAATTVLHNFAPVVMSMLVVAHVI